MNEPNFHKIRIEIEGPRLELFVNEMPLPIRSLELSASMDTAPAIKAEIIPGVLPKPKEDIESLRHRAEALLQMYYTQKNLEAADKYAAEQERKKAEE